MGFIDDVKDKAKDIMDDPDKKAKIEEMAEKHGITIEAAKEKFLNKDKEEKNN